MSLSFFQSYSSANRDDGRFMPTRRGARPLKRAAQRDLKLAARKLRRLESKQLTVRQ